MQIDVVQARNTVHALAIKHHYDRFTTPIAKVMFVGKTRFRERTVAELRMALNTGCSMWCPGDHDVGVSLQDATDSAG